MKKILVSNIDKSLYGISSTGLSSLLDGFDTHKIIDTPWKDFPYRPEVSFAIAHSNDCIFLKYFVSENAIRAVNSQINSAVWEDSCVEFFIHFNDDKGYYNFEFNCIGTQLGGFGKTRSERDLLPKELVGTIQTESFISKVKAKEAVYWELSVAIPLNIFIHHQFSTLSGQEGRVNFHKCGDQLPMPHFLAWNNIQSSEPNFHLPEFFGEIYFE
jgi:hypothetical protein